MSLEEEQPGEENVNPSQKVSNVFSKYWDFITFADAYGTNIRQSYAAHVKKNFKKKF